jgi:hypothetical protein
MRLSYVLRLFNLGPEDFLLFGTIFGVCDLTLPALDSEPCVGTVSPPCQLQFLFASAEFKIKLCVRTLRTKASIFLDQT